MPRPLRTIPGSSRIEVWLALPSARSYFRPERLTAEQFSVWQGLRSERRRRDWEVARALALAISDRRERARSLSHRHGHAAMALARDGRVGVDVEVCVPRDGRALAPGLFTAREAAWIRDQPDDAAAGAAFHTVWVLKEAVAKAWGLSLFETLPLADFGPALTGARDAEGLLARDEWVAWVYEPRPQLRLAVFASGPGSGGVEPTHHEWPEASDASWPLLHRLQAASST